MEKNIKKIKIVLQKKNAAIYMDIEQASSRQCIAWSDVQCSASLTSVF